MVVLPLLRGPLGGPCDTVSNRMAGRAIACCVAARLGNIAQLEGLQRKKPDPCGSGFEFVGAGADHHLPEGNFCRTFRSQSGRMGDRSPTGNTINMPTNASRTTRKPA